MMDYKDCMTNWRLYYEVYHEISKRVSDATDQAAKPVELVINEAKIALNLAYEKAINYFIDQLIYHMVNEIIGELGGSFKTKLTKLERESYTINPANYMDIGSANVEAFLSRSKVVFIVREASVRPFSVQALIVEPLNPDGYVNKVDLGSWERIDYTHNAIGIIMLGGSQQESLNESPVPVASFLDIQSQPPKVSIVADPFDASVAGMISAGNGRDLIILGDSNISIVPLRRN